MAKNQKEKLSPEKIRQREEINIFIENALNDNISNIIKTYFPTNKGTYYDNVVKIPITAKFIKLIKAKMGVDLNDFLRLNKDNTINNSALIEKLEGRILALENDIESLEKDKQIQNEYIELLKRELNKKGPSGPVQ